MGIRDLLMGVESLQSGIKSYGGGVATEELKTNLPSLIQDIRGGNEQAQSEAASKILNYQSRGAELDKNVSDDVSALLFGLRNKVQDGKKPLTAEELMTQSGGLFDAEEAARVAKLDREAQKEALGVKKEFYKQGEVSGRQKQGQAYQTGQKNITSAEGLAKDINQFSKGYDESVSQVDSLLKAAIANPNKATVGGLAVAMSKAAGNTGAFTDRDMDNAMLQSLGGKISSMDAFISGIPGDAIPPEIQQAMFQMAKKSIELSKAKRDQLVKQRFKTGVAGSAERVLSGGKKAPIVKELEKQTGVKVDYKDGEVQFTEEKNKFSGRSAEIMNAANKTGRKEVIEATQRALSNLKPGQDIGENAYNAMMSKISGGK